MKENCKRIEKLIFVSLIVFILLLESNLSFGQKGFYMEEKDLIKKYRVANKNFIKGKELFLKENYNKAEKELTKCIDRMPEHADAYFFLSQIFYKKGDFQQALNNMEKAKVNFKYMDKLYLEAQQQYFLDLKERRENLEEKLNLLKENLASAIEAKRGQIESEIPRIKGEINTIDAKLNDPIYKSKQVPADYFYLNGNIFFKLKKYQEAFREYLEAIKKNPQHGNAYNNLANLYFMGKEYQKALDCLNQAEVNGAEINLKLKKAILEALEK